MMNGGAGEMNFAPTKMAHAFEDEAVEGSGRNEFRPYNEDATACVEGEILGQKKS
jgi:hypothetical protein